MRIPRLATFAATVLLLTGACAAWGQGREGAPPVSRVTLMVNPLGLLQFGPIAQLEIPVSPDLSILAHLRLHGLGMLSYLLFTDTPAFWSLAAGSGVRYFFRSGSSPHAPYLGALLEVGYNPYSGNAGYSNAYAGSAVYLTLTLNGGYRWRFAAFFLEVGGYAGASPTVWSQWHFNSTPSVIHDGDTPTVFFGMAEVSFGWQL
jgi:hypothetical protein